MAFSFNNKEELDGFFKYGKSDLNPIYKPQLRNPTNQELSSAGRNVEGPDLEIFPVKEQIGQVFEPYGGVKPIDKKLTEFDLQDIPEARAQAQSKGVKWLTGLGRIGTKVLSETAKIPGELYGVGDWASTGFDPIKFEETVNNEWVKSIDNFAKKTNDEILPVYKRRVVENGGLLRQVVSPEFWATEGADGIGFLISMMGPGLVTKSLKIPKMVSEGSKLLGLSAKSSLKVGKYADDIVAGGINTIIESTAEGIEAANSTKAALYDKKVKSLMATGQYNQQEASDLAAQYLETPEAKTIIGKAGANTTAANMAILLGPNILDQKWLFNGFNRAGKASKDINKKLFQTVKGIGVEGAEQVGKYTSKQLAKEGLTKAGIGIGKEGFFEEGTQFATSEYFKNRALGQDDRGVVEGILGTYMESLSDTDMQKSIFLGSVLGGGMGSIGAVRGKKLEDKLLYGDSKKGTVGLSELFKNNFVNRYKTISDLTEKDENGNPIYSEDGSPKIDLAKAKTWGSNIVNDEINKQMLEYYNSLGLTNPFDFAKMVHDFNYMMPFFQQEGGKEMLLQHINNLAEKDATYLKETLGIEPQSVQQIRQELLNKADKFEDIYYRVAQAHKIPNVEIEKRDVKTFDEFNKSILDTKLSNELSQIFVADKIEETDREIQTLSSKANRTSLEEPKLQKLIKAKEAFIENLEDLKKEAKELNNSNSIKESWTEYKNNLNKTKKDIIDEAVESAETSRDIEDITSTVGTEEFEANNPPEVAEAIFGKINKKAKEETVNTAHTPKFPLKDRSTRLLKKKYSIKSYDELVEDYVTAKKRVKDLQFNIQYYYQIKDNKLTSDEKESLGQIFKDAIKELNIIEEAMLNSNFEETSPVIEMLEKTESSKEKENIIDFEIALKDYRANDRSRRFYKKKLKYLSLDVLYDELRKKITTLRKVEGNIKNNPNYEGSFRLIQSDIELIKNLILNHPELYEKPIKGVLSDESSITKKERNDAYEKELEFLLKEEAIELHPTDDRIFIIRDVEYYNYAANAVDAINRDKEGNIVSVTLLDKNFNQKTFTKEKIVDFISYYILTKELTTYEEQLEEKIDIAKSKEVITDIVNEEVNIESKSEIYELHRLLDEAVEINSELNKLFNNTFAQYIELGFKKAEILQDPEIFEINQQKDIIERSIVDIKRKINKLKPNSFNIKKDKPVNKKIKVYESNIKENRTEVKLGNQVGIKEQIAQGESPNIRQQIEELQVPAEPVVPFAEERYAEAPATFVIDKAEFIKRIKELPVQDKNTEEFINLLSRVKTPKQLDNAITTNTISGDIQDVIAEVYKEANTSQNKKKAKEEKEFDRQIDKLQANPVDSEVEGTIEPSVNFTTDIPTEKSNVFHINASQYKVNNIDGKRQVVGDKLPFANQFNWEAINNLPIGSELTAKIDPDHIVYIKGKPLKNSEVAPNQQLVSLFSEDGVEVGILYTQNEANKALFPIWRSEVQNKGEKKFKVVQKYKGDIATLEEIVIIDGKDKTIIPAARNSLTDIERAYGKKLILGYVHGTTAGSIVKTPNKDIPEIRLGAKNKSGQIVVALPKGNGEYMAYSLITKSLRQGEGADYKNVSLKENNAFREVLDSLKGLQVGNIEGNEALIDTLHSFISLPTLISTNKKTGTPYIQFNPVHIKKRHLEAFEKVKGINFYPRENKKEGDPGAYVVLVSKDIIDNLQLQKYDEGTPEAALMDFLGEMKLQIDGSKLNQDDYYETVSKRTKTNLANDPVVNVSFFIQPTTDEVQLTPKEVDTTVQKSRTKDISDVKKEEELPAKELGNIKDNITEVSNLDQTDGKPIKIETPTKRGRTTLVRKPESKLRTGTGTYKVWNKEKELNWLSKQLPNIPVEVLSNISDLQQGLDSDVYGRFENSLDVLGNPVGTIKLAENTKVGTAYHEAFHTVFWVGLNSRQRKSVLKDARNKYGEFSDDILEEMMADDFIPYVETEGNIEVKGNAIRNFFEKIYNWIKYNIFGQVEIKNLYYKINSGQYANLKPVKVNVSKLSSSLRPAIFEDRVNTLVANFSIKIDEYIDEHPELINLNRTQLLKNIDTEGFSNSIEFFLVKAYNDLYADYSDDKDSDWGKSMEIFLNEITKEYTIDKKVLWGPIGLKALRKIGAREGFKVHANQILNVQNANPDEEYEISEEETRSEGWQVDVKSQSGQMGLSNEVRKELSYLAIYKMVEKDGKLVKEYETDDLGYQRYVDFDTVYATLKRELADLYTAERIEKKLQEITSTTRPELIEVYNKFISEDPNNKLFRTKFVNDFAKTHVDFKMAVQKNDGRVVIYSSNSTTIVNMIIDSWQSEFYNSGYFTPDGNVNVDKITPIINEILKAPTVVEKMRLFNDSFNLDLDSRVFDNISQDMLYIIGDLSKGNNIFETNTSKLKELAKLDAKYKTDLLESSFRNIEGKTVYSHILPSFTSKQIANMKYDFDTWYNYYSTDTFYKNSPLLNSILKDRSILDNLEYSMIDGSKYKGESEGTSYADFSDKQFLSMQINMFYNNGAKGYGWYQTPILSDSPEGVYIKLPKYKTSDALDKLVEVAKQEYERIKESNDNKLGVKNFDENANKFLFMTFLRRPDLEKSDAEIKQIIKEGLSKKFNDYWEFLQKNNIFDLSDNLGVTRELIPNYFQMKEDKRTTLTEEETNVVKASIWNYFLNQVYAGSQIITLTTGDPAFYKSVTDYYKRAKEIVSPTMQMDNSAVYVLSEDEIENEGTSEQVITPGENYTTLYVNDVNIIGQIGKELFDTFTKTGDIFYAQTAAKYGYSNDKDGKFLEIEIEGKKYKFKSDLVNVADAQTFISPNRYRKVAVGYGRWDKQIQQTFGRMVSNKTLLPEDYQVAMQPYKPFVFGHIKQGNKVIPVQNKNSEMTLFPQLAKASPTLQKLYDIMQENNLDSVSFESVVKVGLSNAVSWEDLLSGIDIKDKIHTLDNSNYGLQQEVPVHYIDDSALFGTQIMKHIIANLDLTTNYNGRTGQELTDYFQKLIAENVEISYKQAREELGLSGDIVDNKKLSEILQREILSRDLGEDIFEAAGLDINGEFNIHPADPLHSDRNEKLLNSIYKNRVTKQKIKGGSFVQASGIGFMDDLQMATKKNPDGTIKSIDYAECMLPWSSRKFFEPFMDKDGIIDINKVPSDLLDMIGYRIPTEDKYSMLPLRVVDFLPAQMGGVVMLPMEITTLAGSDFDVDKLYIMMPEFEISSDKQDIRKITDITTTEGRNNMLIDLMRDVLTNEKTFKQFIKPGGFADLQKNSNIIYLVAEKVGKYSNIVNWSDKQINDAVESLIAKQGIDLTSPLSNARMFNRNMTGKKLVGIEANHNANHSILQFTNIALSKPIIIDGKTYQSLHDIYNNAGELISNNVAQRLAAVVDNAKDPNAFKANLNTYTADVDALLTRLGVPMMQSFALLKQPIVVELTRLYYLHGGDFNAEETAIKHILENVFMWNGGGVFGFTQQPKEFSRIEDENISLETLIEGLSSNYDSASQKDVFIKFLIYKNKSKSLADLIRSMGSMTNGAGPTLADNEIVIRNQRQILLDENLVGVAELFSGEKYPLFKSFNDNGLIKPQEDLKKVFPLGDTNEDSWVNKTKLLLQNSIAKNKLSAKDLNKFNNFILSYISDGFELYDPKLQKYFVENFPAKYKKTLEANPELKEFRITKFIKFQQDDNFPFGRLEFNNTGALTNTLKDDLKDSWYQMFTDDNPETRKFALNLFRYSKYKEGFLFGPKTFTHLQPTKFFTSVEEGRVINKAWKKVFKAEDLDMNPKDSERVVKQFIRNNWKNTGFVPIVEETSKITFVEGKPSAVSVNIKDSKYKTDTGFVEFVKVPIQIVVDKKTKTDYVLMEKVYQTFNKQGQPITAVYRPTNKLGKSAYLVETNRMMDNFSSILPENNVGKIDDVDIRKLTSSTVVEEANETFESEENIVSLRDMNDINLLSILEKSKYSFLAPILKYNGTKLEIVDNTDREGIYLLGKNKIEIGKHLLRSEELTETIAHEAIHAIIDWETTGTEKRKELEEKLVPFIEEIRNYFNNSKTGQNEHIRQLLRTFNKSLLNENGNFEEIITYAFTDKMFAVWLNSIPAEGIKNETKTFWGKLKDIILDILTPVVGKTKLDELNDILDSIFTTNPISVDTKTVNDILESFGSYEAVFTELGLTKENVKKMSPQELGKLLNEEIC